MVKYMKAETAGSMALTVVGAIGITALYIGVIAGMMYRVGIAAGYLV